MICKKGAAGGAGPDPASSGNNIDHDGWMENWFANAKDQHAVDESQQMQQIPRQMQQRPQQQERVYPRIRLQNEEWLARSLQ